MKHRVTSKMIFMTFIIVALMGIVYGGAVVGAQESQTLRVAFGSDLDPADVADLLGMEILEGMGYTIEILPMASDATAVAGLISGDLDFGPLGLPDAIKAMHIGVPLRTILPSNMVFEFVLIGQPGISTVEDLVGKRVAYHAPGSGTEILPRMLVRQSGTVTEDQVEWIILPESPNRAAAMEADRIDVTALEFADVLTLREGGKNYSIIGSFSDIAPEAISSAWVTMDSYAQANPQVMKDLAAAVAQGYEIAANDKEAWMAKGLEMLPLIPEERLSETYEFYSSIGMFPQSPYYTEELWTAMNDFFISVGEFEDPAPYEMVVADAVAAAVEVVPPAEE